MKNIYVGMILAILVMSSGCANRYNQKIKSLEQEIEVLEEKISNLEINNGVLLKEI